MAWSAWSSAQRTSVLSGSNYEVLVEWRYRRDFVANVSQVQTSRLGIRSKTAYHSFTSASTTLGLTAPGVGHAECIQTGESVSVSANSTTWVNLPDTTSASIAHTSTGAFPTGHHIDWYVNTSVSITGAPSGMVGTSWHRMSLNGKIPSIPRDGGRAVIDSTTVSYSKVSGKAHLQFWGPIYARIVEKSSTWTKVGETSKDGGQVSFSFTGLEPGTAYTLQVYGKRSYNGVNASTASKTITTKALADPSVPKCTTKETDSEVIVTMSSGGVVYDGSVTYDGDGGALNICFHKDPASTEEGTYTGDTLPPWRNFDFREYMTADALRAGYTVQSKLEPGLWGFRVWTNMPLTGKKSIRQWVAYIGQAGNVYIKTSAGWKKAQTVYVMTSAGWKKAQSVSVNTENGWK